MASAKRAKTPATSSRDIPGRPTGPRPPAAWISEIDLMLDFIWHHLRRAEDPVVLPRRLREAYHRLEVGAYSECGCGACRIIVDPESKWRPPWKCK
jgi:hypothetical protein